MVKKILVIVVCFFFAWVNATLALAKTREQSQTTVLRIVSLVDYIAVDYKMAVARDGGHVINKDEYAEMVEFSALIEYFLDALNLSATSKLKELSNALKLAVKNKKTPLEVKRLALELKDLLIQNYSIATAAKVLPDLQRGQKLYEQNCSICHGSDGQAMTTAAKQLRPPPVAFTDPEVLAALSPFKAYNTITFGVKGTAMPEFSALSDDDRWSLAAYLFQFRKNLPPPNNQTPLLPWKKTMSMSDEELVHNLQSLGVDEKALWQQVSQIRHLRYNKNQQLVGNINNEKGVNGSSQFIRGILLSQDLVKESLMFVEKGDYQRALDLAVSAYIDGFEQVETFLKSTNRVGLSHLVEKKFMQFRLDLRRHDPKAKTSGANLMSSLEAVQRFLESKKDFSPRMAFLASYTIILREGMEAILLLAIILSVLNGIKESQYKKWVHISWIFAVIMGGFTWLFAKRVIDGAVREGMEGLISIIAATVLIYVSYWLFAKRDAEKWKRYLVGKIKHKKKLAIYTVALVAFLAVYREIFETILFFEALQLQAVSRSYTLILGIVLGFVSLIIVAWIIFRMGKQIPLNLFFGGSGLVLYLLAVIFVGQGIHSLQEAGYIPLTPVALFTMPSLGIFASLEVLIPQGVLIALFVIGLIWQQWFTTSNEGAKIEKISLELLNIHELGEHLREHLNQLKSKLEKGSLSSKTDINEILTHMAELDQGIHHLVLQMNKLSSELPQRFDEIYQEVRQLKGRSEYNELIKKSQEFKLHLSSIKRDRA